jgi:lipoprotein NlpD
VNRTRSRIVLAFSVLALAAGCTAKRGAPVIERAPEKSTSASRPAPAARAEPRASEARPEFYTVKRGDTLYSIALEHGLDYRELALWNGISDPSALRAGERLRLSAPGRESATTAPARAAREVEGRPLEGGASRPASAASAAPVVTEPRALRLPYSEDAYARIASAGAVPAPAPSAEPRRAAPREDTATIEWGWPARGKLVSTFSESGAFKGIGIAGKKGQPVVASAAGRVIFSGTGIRGFGKLIVIKHNDTYLSVYAHNSELLVKEGQMVEKGQKIAEMGDTDADQVKLHFEIRRYGKPVDPLKLLPPA